ncbi:ABC transporter substrate-binding protein [Spirulina sp. CS-785/01]|uniref:ABC transporter substrate-binding protein n=1 Tax=Spirulina sp. CS-785/01 TaxID=3021716 RepID=UPI00232F0939|nr:ABC transporter substrate-binding protein [Spirulina sp. CS-785/01]MDB9311487.1 ABC transporter substrate-binding protein [Spirulina sp. CS-785/01]
MIKISQFFQSIQNFLKPKIPRFLALILSTLAILHFIILPAFTQQPVTVRVLMQALEANQWQPLEEKFEEENPDINLEIIEGPNDTNLVEDLYTSAFLLGDSPYDLVYMDIVWVPKFAAAGWLEDLSDRVSPAELDKFLEGDVNGSMYEGGLYRMPFRSDGGMLYYRTDLLEAGGYDPPETFSELMQISQELKEQDIADWGYVWQGKQYEGLAAMFVEILKGHGAFWVNPDTLEVGLDSPEAIDAVKFLKSTINEGISPPGVTTYAEEETRRIFQNDDVVFLRNWPYVFALAQESEISGQFAIKPMVHEPGEPSGACQGGWGLGISKSSQHPDEAWRVAKFISSRETQKQYILKTGYVPSRKSLFNDPEVVEKYSHYPQLLEVVENAALRPPIAQYAQASDILQRYLSAALTGTMTPEEAMNTAAQETRNLFAS